MVEVLRQCAIVREHRDLPRNVRSEWIDTTVCRACGSTKARQVLDLRRVPLANDFLPIAAKNDAPVTHLAFSSAIRAPSPRSSRPLIRKSCPSLSLHPSQSTTWVAHSSEPDWMRAGTTTTDPFVVEPASNIGCLLKAVQSWAPRVLGIEPALNIAAKAVENGIPTVAEFFTRSTAISVRDDHGPADVVAGTNVLAHVPDIIDFLQGVAELLTPNGFVVVEAPYLRDLVETLADDTIYHEHVSYLSVTALDRVYRQAGLS